MKSSKELEALEEFLEAFDEFLSIYLEGGEQDGLDTGVALFNRYGYQRLCNPNTD